MTDTLLRLEQTIAARKGGDPATSYVASLFAKGRAKIAQKVGEEATETVIAAMSGDTRQLTAESADLIFHLLILLAEGGVSLSDVTTELARREGLSGHTEKSSRTE